MNDINDSEIAKIQLRKWQDFIEAKLGFILPRRQKHWLEQGVSQVSDNVGLSSSHLLERVKTDLVLRQQLFDAVLIPESRFFRHYDSLDFIGTMARQAKLYHTKQPHVKSSSLTTSKPPTQIEKTQGRQHSREENISPSSHKYRVWSVGCSFGQEIWSLAMILDDLLCPFEVWGTDVSERVLVHAKQATYSSRELDNIPKMYHAYTQKQDDSTFKIVDKLHESVHFVWQNIFSTEQVVPINLDAIICQNVLIYFRRFDQRDILARLVDQLAIGGYLVLAPGEASQWQHPQMSRVDNRLVNVWEKIVGR